MAETPTVTDTDPPLQGGVRRLLQGGAGGRQTQPSNYNPFAAMPYAFVPRRLLCGMDLTQYTANDFAPWQLMQLLADSHTDVGLALWNVLRLGTAQFEFTVQTPAGQDDADGKALADAVVAGINPRAGGLDALMVQWMGSWYLQGAVCGELALTEDLTDVLDIYPVNPWTIFFRRDALTQELLTYQQQLYGAATKTPGGRNGSAPAGADEPATHAGGYRRLNPELVVYIPCDPVIDDPYGRIPAGNVINEVFFDVHFMADLQKVVHGAAVPRYVVRILEEVLKRSCPASIANNPDKYLQWLDARLSDVQAQFSSLEPDEAFVGYDSVAIEVLGPKSGANTLSMVHAIVKVLELRRIKALKMLPILMANNEGTTETHGSVQYEIFAEAIHSAQSSIANMFCRFLTVALQVRHGRVCVVEGRFRQIRSANRYVDAGSENRELVNAAIKEALGYQTHDESAIEVTGSAAVSPPLPGVLAALVPHVMSATANPSVRAAAGGAETRNAEEEE